MYLDIVYRYRSMSVCIFFFWNGGERAEKGGSGGKYLQFDCLQFLAIATHFSL